MMRTGIFGLSRGGTAGVAALYRQAGCRRAGGVATMVTYDLVGIHGQCGPQEFDRRPRRAPIRSDAVEVHRRYPDDDLHGALPGLKVAGGLDLRKRRSLRRALAHPDFQRHAVGHSVMRDSGRDKALRHLEARRPHEQC